MTIAMKQRVTRAGLRGALGLLAALGATAVATAQTAPTPDASVTTTNTTYGNWTLRCESRKAEAKTQKICEVSSSITVKGENGTGGIAATIALGRYPDKKDWQVAVQLPIIVWLPTGAKIGLNDATPLADAGFVACRATLCSAGTTMTPQQIGQLKAASADFLITYQAQTRQTVKVMVPVKGLDGALNALEAEMKKA